MSDHSLPPGEEPRWLDHKENIDKLYKGLLVICGILFLADFVYHKHPHFDVEGLPGFYAIYGFAAFSTAVLGAKQLRKIIRRSEDYYDD